MIDWTSLVPNLIAYWDQFIKSLSATVQMFLLAGIFIFLFGFFFAILLIVTQDGGIRPNRTVHRIVEICINVFRSIPFVILMIFLMPFTRAVVGTAVGVKGAIIPLIFGTVPFYTRQIETSLANVDPGKIEAARSMGCSSVEIVWGVYIHEAVPELIRVTTITAISLIGLTTMAGAVGAGGIGSFAINYGQSQHHQDIVNVCVIVLLVIVSLIQTLGNVLARKTTNRALIRRKIKQ